MIQSEWLTSTDPQVMLPWLKLTHPYMVTERKLRLWLCGCSRRDWNNLIPAQQNAIHKAELYADGLQSMASVRAAANRASRHRDAVNTEWNSTVQHACEESYVTGNKYDMQPDHKAISASVIREIFGNPFYPLSLPDSFSHDIESVAQVAYEEREEDGSLARENLFTLSDALVDMGYGHETCPACKGCKYLNTSTGLSMCDVCRGHGRLLNVIVEHLRYPMRHYRGCFAVDLLLGKK